MKYRCLAIRLLSGGEVVGIHDTAGGRSDGPECGKPVLTLKYWDKQQWPTMQDMYNSYVCITLMYFSASQFPVEESVRERWPEWCPRTQLFEQLPSQTVPPIRRLPPGGQPIGSQPHISDSRRIMIVAFLLCLRTLIPHTATEGSILETRLKIRPKMR